MEFCVFPFRCKGFAISDVMLCTEPEPYLLGFHQVMWDHAHQFHWNRCNGLIQEHSVEFSRSTTVSASFEHAWSTKRRKCLEHKEKKTSETLASCLQANSLASSNATYNILTIFVLQVTSCAFIVLLQIFVSFVIFFIAIPRKIAWYCLNRRVNYGL